MADTDPYARARKEQRVVLKIPVVITSGKEQIQVLTENFSFRGIYLRMDNPPPIRSFIRLSIPLTVLPDNFSLTGTVVHRVPAKNPLGRAPGVGVEFFANTPASRTAWLGFVNDVATRAPKDRAAIVAEVEHLQDPVQRTAQRYDVVLRVRFKDRQDLLTAYSQNISARGMFIRTDKRLEIDQRLILQLSTDDDDATFELTATVRRLGRDTESWGIGVEFSEMDDEQHAALRGFILPLVDDDDLETIPTLTDEEVVLLDTDSE